LCIPYSLLFPLHSFAGERSKNRKLLKIYARSHAKKMRNGLPHSCLMKGRREKDNIKIIIAKYRFRQKIPNILNDSKWEEAVRDLENFRLYEGI
jgi:hypothetical protein